MRLGFVGLVLETAAPGTVVAVHSTVEPDTPAEPAARGAAAGVRHLDANSEVEAIIARADRTGG